MLSLAPTDRPVEATTATVLLRRAWAEGVTTFDVTDAPDAAAAETLLARAFPDPDPTLVVIGPPPAPSGTAGAASSAPARLAGPWVAGPAGSVPTGWRPHRLIEVGVEAWLRTQARPPRPPADGAVLGYVVRCRSPEEARKVREAPGTRPELLAGPISILRRELVGEAAAERGERGLRWLARDPFAGGRLDGSWFEKALVSPPSVGPRPVRELETEFGPVGRLRFLVLAGHRSLAQAAVRYVLDVPGVSWASVPLPRVERWEEILRYDRSPPLDDRDRAAIGGLA